MDPKIFRKLGGGNEPHYAPHLNTVPASKSVDYHWLNQPAVKKPKVDLAKTKTIQIGRQGSVEDPTSPIGSPSLSVGSPGSTAMPSSPPISTFSFNNFVTQPTGLKSEKQFYHTFDFKS
ncbi:uncharacterized protein LOC110466613 [Mizuhopecten yessoensis]|uniref:Uncharacterized protein n=1 Tax=Mizuhopecten yessoensis TaxID=6573 RepID=A0A210PNS9_MIZYE|nr:uncharacterized protein LOC110466613 [Mizuhopecten yessoensis]OWF38123.1 hypothetical protein KP79_PYT08849 [Mizuhopecten yessoensis]